MIEMAQLEGPRKRTVSMTVLMRRGRRGEGVRFGGVKGEEVLEGGGGGPEREGGVAGADSRGAGEAGVVGGIVGHDLVDEGGDGRVAVDGWERVFAWGWLGGRGLEPGKSILGPRDIDELASIDGGPGQVGVDVFRK